MLPVAVILSGCGKNDGSEIQEAVCCLLHLDRLKLQYACFAPDKPQSDVIDHLRGRPARESRNVLVESARIARGAIADIASLDVRAVSGLVFPGGFGAAKNLCTFATDGPACSVDPHVERIVRESRAQRKPIALCCIAPVIAARVLGTSHPGCQVTIGTDQATAAAIGAMGARHVARDVTKAAVDGDNLLVTTPAYMCDTTPWAVFTGIGAMIDEFAMLLPR